MNRPRTRKEKKGGEILIMRGRLGPGGMGAGRKGNPARAGELPLRFGCGFAALEEGIQDSLKGPPGGKTLPPGGRVEGLFPYNSE